MLKPAEELKQLVIGLCVSGKMTVKAGAERLGLSECQVKNLQARFKRIGATSILHGNCGRQPAHAFTPEAETPSEASPQGARERFGVMLQTDATSFDWFGIGERFALHALIDDATGKLAGLYMSKNECAEGYFCVLKQTVQIYGVPQNIYADGLSLFFGTSKPTLEEQLEGKPGGQTQFGEIMAQLGTHIIHARSPQAKGRVERLWETLQSRLPVEFKKHGIADMEAANQFLAEEYAGVFNQRLGMQPTNTASAFMQRPKGIVLDRLLSLRYSRTVDQSGCFSF